MLPSQVSVFHNFTSGLLRWSTQAPRPSSPSSAASFLPAVTRASCSARVFVCMPDVHLTAFHQTSHAHNSVGRVLPTPGTSPNPSTFNCNSSFNPPLPLLPASPLLVLATALALGKECIVFANRNLPCVMTRHAWRAGNLKMRQSARTHSLWHRRGHDAGKDSCGVADAGKDYCIGADAGKKGLLPSDILTARPAMRGWGAWSNFDLTNSVSTYIFPLLSLRYKAPFCSLTVWLFQHIFILVFKWNSNERYKTNHKVHIY